MQKYNKTAAAAIAGALVTIFTVAFKAIDLNLAAKMLTPEFVAAVQMVFTAGVVYFSPANKHH